MPDYQDLIISPSTHWSGNITYSFGSGIAFGTSGINWLINPLASVNLNADQILAAESAIRAWQDVAGIQIQYNGLGSQGTITYYAHGFSGNILFGTNGAVTNPPNQLNGGDVWLNNDFLYDGARAIESPASGNWGWFALLHETGHALGLSLDPSHGGGEDGFSAEYTVQTTIMSYRPHESYLSAGIGALWPITPMPLDIEAIQALYGPNLNTRNGPTTYSFANLHGTIQTIWDAGGSDTIDLSSSSESVVVNLTPGSYSSIGGHENIAIANAVTVAGTVVNFLENVIGGSAADHLTGNAAANVFRGNAGDDTIDGGLGNDTAVYALALDHYSITFQGSNVTVAAIFQAPLVYEGTDTLTSVENFEFAGRLYSREQLVGILNPTTGSPGATGDQSGATNGGYSGGGTGTATSGADVIPGDVTSTFVVGITGQALTSAIETAGDKDYVKVYLVQGDTYRISMQGAANHGYAALQDSFFRVRDGQDHVLASPTDQPGGDQLDYTAGYTGWHYISIGAGGASFATLTGGYSLAVTLLNSPAANHAPVANTDDLGVQYGQTITGNVLANDTDADGNTLTVDFLSSYHTALGGTVDLLANGAFQYIAPTSGPSTAQDSFTYTAYDGAGGSAGGVVHLNLSQPGGGALFTAGNDYSTVPTGGGIYHALGGNDVAFGSTYSDIIYGDDGNDFLHGLDGNDVLYGGTGDDGLIGGPGDDWLVPGSGTNQIWGDGVSTDFGGFDTVDYSDGTGGITVNMQQGTVTGGGVNDFIQSVDGLIGSGFADFIQVYTSALRVYGGGGGDTIVGWTLDDEFHGGSGDDQLQGQDGNDRLYGDDGNDTLYGGVANDILDGGAGNDQVFGEDGDDTIMASAGSDRLVGGNGVDTVDYSQAPAGLTGQFTDYATVYISVAGWGSNSHETIENLIASPFDDDFNAGGPVLDVHLGAGNDHLFANAIERAFGDDGNDQIYALDVGQVFGGAGNDLLSALGNTLELYGDDGDDLLLGSDGLNHIYYGGAGNDTVHGGGGADLLDGGSGQDLLYGESGDDVIFGGDGNDRLDGGAGSNTLHGDGGNDQLFSGGSADVLDGGDGVDFANYGAAASGMLADEGSASANTGDAAGDQYSSIEGLVGSNFDDVLRMDDFKSSIWALGGNDTLDGRGGNDDLHGQDGNDHLIGGAGADVLDGGFGFDFAEYGTATGGLTVDEMLPATNTGDAAGDQYFSIEGLVGSNYSDVLRTDGFNNSIWALDGNDVVDGRGGNDELHGQSGNDQLIGGAGADILDGGGGFDFASYVTATAGVNANIVSPAANTGDASGDTYISIEGLVGSNYNDTLRIGNGGGSIWSLNGNDTLFGGTGNDDLHGGMGVDHLIGGAGADVLDSNGGFSFADYSTAAAGVLANILNPAGNTGDAAGDSYISIRGIVGSNFNDTLQLGNGGGSIWSLNGNDILIGGTGNDDLHGGAGVDHLIGGAGADLLDGTGGFSFADYSTATAGVSANISNAAGNTGDAAGDSYISVRGIVGSNFNDTLQLGNGGGSIWSLNGNDGLTGGSGNDDLHGGIGNDTLNGGLGFDSLEGGVGSDIFVFRAGEANGDTVLDFSASGEGDRIQLVGYGAGATFTQNDATHWQANYNGGASHDIIVFANAAAIHPSDYLFV